MRWLVIGLVAVVGCTSVEPAPESTTTTQAATTTSTLAPVTTTAPAPTTTTSWPYEDAERLDFGPLAARGGHSVVWTGTEVIVWGGLADEMGTTGRFNDGAAFNPVTGQWRMIAEAPLSPRWFHLSVWTGEEMLVIGGGTTEAAAYDPSSDEWRMIPDAPWVTGGERDPYAPHLWDGSRLLIWNPSINRLASYEPETDAWTNLTPPPVAGSVGKLIVGGGDLYAFGNSPAPVPLNGAVFVNGVWESIPEVDLSTAEYNVWAPPHLAVWTGDRVFAFSDSGSEGAAMTYARSGDRWEPVDPIPMNGCEFVAPPVPFDDGWYAPSCGRNWIITTPSLDWSEIDTPGLTDTRYAVWVEDEFIVWGSPCCFGTGGDSFRIESWRFTP